MESPVRSLWHTLLEVDWSLDIQFFAELKMMNIGWKIGYSRLRIMRWKAVFLWTITRQPEFMTKATRNVMILWSSKEGDLDVTTQWFFSIIMIPKAPRFPNDYGSFFLMEPLPGRWIIPHTPPRLICDSCSSLPYHDSILYALMDLSWRKGWRLAQYF